MNVILLPGALFQCPEFSVHHSFEVLGLHLAPIVFSKQLSDQAFEVFIYEDSTTEFACWFGG